MKRLFLALALLFSASLAAQAPEPMPLAHGNTPGEPHHHLKIENEYLRVYYVEVPPRENTQLHQHDHDYLFVTLGDSNVINAVRDKPEVHLVLKDGETHFTRGGFAHVARNLADTPFRNITIELLRPQENVRNRCERLIDGPLNDCPSVGGQQSIVGDIPASLVPRPSFETDETIGILFTLEANSRHVEQRMPNAALLVALQGSDFKAMVAGQTAVQMTSGSLLWLPASKSSTFTSSGKTASRYMLLLFKDASASTRN
jgi:quercetin dioxygenase-like cupin family protein